MRDAFSLTDNLEEFYMWHKNVGKGQYSFIALYEKIRI